MPTDTSPTLKMNTSRLLPTRIRPDALREKTPGAADAPAVTASAIVPPALAGGCDWSVGQPDSDVNNPEGKIARISTAMINPGSIFEQSADSGAGFSRSGSPAWPSPGRSSG